MKKITLLLASGLFLIAVVLRMHALDAHWSSDEARWLRRSAQFMSAVQKGEFAETLIAYHPGVTTMWFAGLRTFFIQPGVNIENLVFARWLISIVIFAGIGIACFLLYKLFGRWVALVGFVCLAYSPFFLAQTRRVHTDALATIFILITVLLFLFYCQNTQHRRYLIFSGVTFGIALMSKSYALVLLPWVPISLFLFREERPGGVMAYIADAICFLNCTALTTLALWPIFWTLPFGFIAFGLLWVTLILLRAPLNERSSIVVMAAAGIGFGFVCVRAIQTVWNVFDRINWAVKTPHEVEHFFLGAVVNDPGWLFYPFVLTIKSTPLMLPLAIVGCFLLWKRRQHSEETLRQFRIALTLVASVVLFTVCLSSTSKKFSRYLLPAFPMLEILAAIGFVEGFKWSYNVLCTHFGIEQTFSYKNTLVIITCIGLFFIQVFPILALHPYYGTYYNLCWKVTDITKIITVGEASGLDLAARHLNDKSDARKLVAQVSPLATEFVRRYFHGQAYRSDRITRLSPDYEVVYIRDSQIGRVPQTGTLDGELEAVITLNGIDHVWIYRIPNKETP